MPEPPGTEPAAGPAPALMRVTAAPVLQGLSHVTYIVRDLERMARFLCHGLGGSEVPDTNQHSFTRAHERYFMVGGVWIAVTKGEPPRERSYQHLAFQVRPQDLPVCRERLAALGVEFRPARRAGPGEAESLYFYDFDDHLFELRTTSLRTRLQQAP
jgi:catechol 2,3-dioxygenase-like lactoylglutathione lyase family enzyme